jgi:hypothetical protein
MWNVVAQQWDYLLLSLIVGLYVTFGAALFLSLLWISFPAVFS